MAKKFSIKPVVNKKNGQINLSIPKKKLSKEEISDISKAKKLRITLEGLVK